MISNGTILLQVGKDLMLFTLHLLPMVLPIIKNGLRSKPQPIVLKSLGERLWTSDPPLPKHGAVY